MEKAHLDGTDLTRCLRLTVEQLVAANMTRSTRFPSDIAEDPRIRAAVEGFHAERESRWGRTSKPEGST
ncbi:hypothetical protein [Kitasatospora sp. NPDC096140]|uniref:hypothetical protein n=1 Tax=Kitasatospora sp. NPDC096140 TaxID=3155425 RepID=UPI00331F893D